MTDNFTFKSKIGDRESPDEFAQSLLKVDGIVTKSKTIPEGDNFVHLYILDIGAKIPMCDEIKFHGDKIASIIIYKDFKLFAP
ncbi:MAG: hypothetical protein AAGA16_08815, partial [Cyanobacteria bacterium P01_E01_bin.35]